MIIAVGLISQGCTRRKNSPNQSETRGHGDVTVGKHFAEETRDLLHQTKRTARSFQRTVNVLDRALTAGEDHDEDDSGSGAHVDVKTKRDPVFDSLIGMLTKSHVLTTKLGVLIKTLAHKLEHPNSSVSGEAVFEVSAVDFSAQIAKLASLTDPGQPGSREAGEVIRLEREISWNWENFKGKKLQAPEVRMKMQTIRTLMGVVERKVSEVINVVEYWVAHARVPAPPPPPVVHPTPVPVQTIPDPNVAVSLAHQQKNDFAANGQIERFFNRHKLAIRWNQVKILIRGLKATYSSSQINDDDNVRDRMSVEYLRINAARAKTNPTTALEIARVMNSDFHKNRQLKFYYTQNRNN